MWQETWFAMSNGIQSEYDQLKRTNVFEFYKIYDLWKKKNELQRATRKQQHKTG